ncbi:MAG TPA: GAF domain-containing protein, partial [Gemmataceae bacterium]|nr:GAF domain-containing protein [Gemmataceae bacterium]
MAAVLGEALDGLLEFTGAAAGCVGVLRPDGRLSFPACRGSLPESWLPLQLGQQGVWGFAVREGPTLLNDLPARPALGEPPLRNLLTAPIRDGGTAVGHVLLANKPAGFTSHDATALQLAAHLMARQLAACRRAADGPPRLPPDLLRLALDRVGDGVVVVDEGGALLYANAAWAEWTGFSPEELTRTRPRPDWIGHRQLATLPSLEAAPRPAPARPALLPFRRHDDSVLWCQVEEVPHEGDGRRLTVALLRPAMPPRPGEAPAPAHVLPALAESLPFALAVLDRRGRVLWANGALSRL